MLSRFWVLIFVITALGHPCSTQAWVNKISTLPAEGLYPSKHAQCGPLSLYGALKALGTDVDYRKLLEEAGTDPNGTTIKGLVAAAQKQGVHAKAVAVTPKGLCRILSSAKSPMIAICHLQKPDHFITWYLNKNGSYTKIDPLNKVVNTATPTGLPRFSGAAILISKEPFDDVSLPTERSPAKLTVRVLILSTLIILGIFTGKFIGNRWFSE